MASKQTPYVRMAMGEPAEEPIPRAQYAEVGRVLHEAMQAAAMWGSCAQRRREAAEAIRTVAYAVKTRDTANNIRLNAMQAGQLNAMVAEAIAWQREAAAAVIKACEASPPSRE
jgi:hypothetical protein